MIPLLIISAIGGEASKLGLSGETNITTDPGSPYNATTSNFRINTDGTIDEGSSIDGVGLSYVQVDSATDWIIPNETASSEYEVRVTNVVGDAFTSSPGADGTWFDLSTARTWTLTHADSSGTDTVTFDFEIRRGSSGAALVSAEYTLIVINTA